MSATTLSRWILHADMDAFYASIEQRDRPELRGKPVLVGGASGRGVVAAASYEARRFGVHSAMPSYQARQRCPEAVFLPPDIARYAAVSAQVHAVFAEFTPLIEPLALDEAFLDITGSVHLHGGPLSLADALKARVRSEVDLAVSIGIAPNKLVSKIACNLAKPDGIRCVAPEEAEALLAPLPVSNLWGVGPVLEAKLLAAGLQRLGDVAEVELGRLRRVVGDRAEQLQALARGLDARPVEVDRAPKSFGEENTFDRDVSEHARISEVLTAHADAVARRLRRAAYRGRTVTLKVKLAQPKASRGPRSAAPSAAAQYPSLTRSRTLPEATQDARRLRATALALWNEADVRTPIRLLGLSVSNLEPEGSEQLELFDAGRRRSERVGHALDAIQARFGAHAIGPAVDAPHKQSPTDRRKPGT